MCLLFWQGSFRTLDSLVCDAIVETYFQMLMIIKLYVNVTSMVKHVCAQYTYYNYMRAVIPKTHGYVYACIVLRFQKTIV